MELLQHTVLFIREIAHSFSCKHTAATIWQTQRTVSYSLLQNKSLRKHSAGWKSNGHILVCFTGQFKNSTANFYCDFLTGFSKEFITV